MTDGTPPDRSSAALPFPAQDPARVTWAEVDLGAIAANLLHVQSRLAPGVRLFAVVKANAYGHGAVPVARACERAGADGLCVALPQEALELRRAGLTLPIQVLGPVTEAEAAVLAAAGVAVTVADAEGLERARRGFGMARAAGRATRLDVHVKVDTGMGRLGLPPEDAQTLVEHIMDHAADGLRLAGVFSHLASADDDAAFTEDQIEQFATLVAHLRPRVGSDVVFHLANSAGAIAYPDAQFDAVRVGIALYGYDPLLRKSELPLRPALSLHSRVSFVKRVAKGSPVSYGHTYHAPGPRTIATVPIGYADGVRRSLTGVDVLVHGRRHPIVGRVTMDQILVEGPENWNVRVGDRVTLLGTQEGEAIWADTWAQRLGTIPYEILTAIGGRVPRIWVAGDA